MKQLTANASRDNLSPADYDDIYTEIRDAMTLRQFIALSGSTLSPARWSQWANGQRPLSRAMRNDLRRAVGLPELPATVGDALAHVDGDAAVWQMGEGTASRVLVLATPDPVTVHWNGTGPERVDQQPVSAVVTGVTATQRRKRYWRPALPAELRQRAAEAGLVGQELARLIERAIADYEQSG